MSCAYANYSKEDLIREIERLKTERCSNDQGITYKNRVLTNAVELQKTFSEVLTLLMTSGNRDAIDQALLTILRFFDVDRVYIGKIEDDKPTFDFTHEVTSQGVISLREDILTNIPKKDYPWWIRMIQEGKEIIIHDVEEMPEEARAEYEILKYQDIVSLLLLPVLCGGSPNGFIGLDCVKARRTWSTLEIENLRMLTSIISIAIERETAHGMVEQSMQQVLQSKAKFQIIFDKLPWGVELYDKNGYLLDINNADLNIFGTTREEAIGLNAFENPNIPEWAGQKLKRGEDVSLVLDYNFDIVKEKGYYSTAITQRVKHLRIKGVVLKDAQQEIVGFFYIVFDDTENYHKTEEIQYNLAKLKAAVDTGESVIWEYDVAADLLTADFSLNDQIEKSSFLSYLNHENFNCLHDFIKTLHPDDLHKVYDELFKRLVNGEIRKYTSVYRRVFDNKVFWISSNVRAYSYFDNGKPSKIVSYTSNITEQREKELELLKVKEADKLKSAFLANMSHEIRTPLNAIVGFSDLIAETEDPEERQSYLDIIHTNNDLLLNLIGDILDFSKIEAGMLKYNIEEVNIRELCLEVYLSGSLKVKPGVRLVFDQNSPSVFLRTDPQRVQQVISNFFNNAIKFTHEGSITIFYETKGNEVKISVQDTGIGISEENKARVFERFIKINDFYQGTGLGLTISKTIIEYLGGTIGVDSVEGKGSTFWFTLPLN